MDNNQQNIWDFIVIGGGAAGYFGAIACAEACQAARILILEATARVLTKVKISGGGRCNVTHFQFDTKQLVTNYPRGQKELIGPFHRFQPKDTQEWFLNHGVTLTTEDDGRMFPASNNSQTIIDCLTDTAEKAGVILQKMSMVEKINYNNKIFTLSIKGKENLNAKHILLATGSMPYGVELAKNLNHNLISPVPSLFTFQINHKLLEGLAGVSFSKVKITLKIEEQKMEFTQQGPCLITHWGLSGPAVLKLSAFAARELFSSSYKANLFINWIFPLEYEEAVEKLEISKKLSPKKKICNENPFECVRRFWDAILDFTEISPDKTLSELNKKEIQNLAKNLTKFEMNVSGKGVFKDEFVTAGGVSRSEIDFRTMESKICKNLFFAGEIIDIDGITGGFNFQNAWTGSWIAGKEVAKRIFENQKEH
jgi:predicted Rossmann fold flavoprotein